MNRLLLLLLFTATLTANSQNTRIIKIVDSTTLDAIPYSTIYFSNNKKTAISDDTGRFELVKSEYNLNDTIFVSTMGYNETSVDLNMLMNRSIEDSLIIYINKKPIDLDEIYITSSDKNYTSKEIIDQIEKNLKYNYTYDLREKKIFFREDVKSIIEDIEITKFKSSIKEISNSLLDSFSSNYRRDFGNEVEILCKFYGNHEKEKQKIKIIKAREILNKNNDITTSLNNRLKQIINENVKSNSYFKIRSGIFSRKFDLSSQEVDSVNKDSVNFFNSRVDEEKSKENFANLKKNNINKIYSKLFFNPAPELTFIKKKNRFNFSEPELTFMGGDLIYIISFYPKKSELYKGKIYVNSDNFAIVRIDFTNIESVFKFKLLGVYADRYLNSGKMFFSKNIEDKYYLSYYQNTSGMRNGAKRHLKIIEKNKHFKGRRKQNQVSFYINMRVGIIYKREMQIFESKPINKTSFENILEENKVLPEYLDSFTTNFWDEF